MTYMVLLADGTVGTIDDDTIGGQHPDFFIGERITVKLSDENGIMIEVDGIMVETLDVL
jgi:hypothetical protein